MACIERRLILLIFSSPIAAGWHLHHTFPHVEDKRGVKRTAGRTNALTRDCIKMSKLCRKRGGKVEILIQRQNFLKMGKVDVVPVKISRKTDIKKYIKKMGK